ncbi:MAG: HlyD family type I secretion periplasmic adaptor subunit [Pseudohongiellaceae bacterium]
MTNEQDNSADAEAGMVDAETSDEATVETTMDGPRRVGLFLFFLVFGVFGLWAGFAPIDGAAHAPGEVTVRSYSKVIQHLEGGIISEILVQNGDSVTAGQPLLVLDDTQSLAQLEIANSQFAALKAMETRLIAERDNLEQVHYPEGLYSSELNAVAEMEAQNQIFRARKAAREGSIEVLEQRIEQLQSRAVGLRALKDSKEVLAASFAEELDDVRALLNDGFSDKLRLRELERSHAMLLGEAAELTASISSTEIQIGETRLEILQQDKEFQNEVVNQLSEAQSRLKDVNERIRALKDVVSRTVVRAPEAGIVVGMQVHTVGGVAPPRTTIAEIVPQTDDMILEARVSPLDIDRVTEGQEATIRFSSFSRTSVPTIYGTVMNISADSLMDESTGISYYLARIEVTPQGVSDLQDMVLMPGMPADVFIATGSRTFLQYLLKPLTNTMARSFIED